MSLKNIYAEKNEAYLLKSGWEKQTNGWLDTTTGLVWGPELEKMSWGQAKDYCEKININDNKEWRLPTVEELQLSTCEIAGYSTRTACKKPRDHNKDLWLLIDDKATTYWASDIIQGDPYNAYYFIFDVEGQHIITSKGDKSKARCVYIKKTELSTVMTNKIEEKEAHIYYIALLGGLGAILSNEFALTNSLYFAGEFRFGYKLAEDFMVQASVESGFTKKFSLPSVTNITLGGEYFILPERLSAFINLGVGIMYNDIPKQAVAGFAWRAGTTICAIKWGANKQYNFPISLNYTGLKTRFMISHTALLSVGFMYFN